MSQIAVLKRHKLFKNGWESVEYEPGAGRPSTSRTDNVQHVHGVFNSDRHLNVRIISDPIGIGKMSAHIITENLTMRNICAKVIPKILTDDQKQMWVWVRKPSATHWRRPRLFGQRNLGRPKLHIWIRLGNKAAKFWMTNCGITSNKQIQSESYAYRFLRR